MSRKKQISPEEVIELQRTLDKLSQIDLDRVHEKEIESLPQLEQMLYALENDKSFKRTLKSRQGTGRDRKTPKLHHNTRIARSRKYKRDYYHAKGRLQERRKKAQLLSTPEGWYKYLRKKWQERKVEVKLTEQQWCDIIWPELKGNVPIVTRYNTGKAASIDNLLIYKNGTRDVLFDGKEWFMKEQGYIL